MMCGTSVNSATSAMRDLDSTGPAGVGRRQPAGALLISGPAVPEHPCVLHSVTGDRYRVAVMGRECLRPVYVTGRDAVLSMYGTVAEARA